jgi:hypothetical protein
MQEIVQTSMHECTKGELGIKQEREYDEGKRGLIACVRASTKH